MPQSPIGVGLEGGIPSPLVEGSGKGAVSSPENFSYFLLKIPYFDAF